MTNETKAKVKEDELKQKRAGKTKNITVTVSDDVSINIQHCLNEMMQLLQMHKIGAADVHMMGTQLQWMAINNLNITNMQGVMNHFSKIMEGKVDKPVVEEEIDVKKEIGEADKSGVSEEKKDGDKK